MSTTLSSLSKDLGDIVEASQDTVVRVDGRQRFPASGFLWSDDGLIVTANHVVRRDEGVRVALAGGESQEAQVVGRDPQRDLAVLRINSKASAIRPVDPGTEARVGNLVLALGRPGASVMATLGILSSTSSGRRQGTTDGYLQTDVVMYPGFSGGPLVNSEAKVLGMNTSGLMRGASLAVPMQRIESSVNSILEHGSVRQGYLGVSLQPVQLSASVAEKLEQSAGLMIVGVEDGSPASRQGLLQGDILVRFASASIQHLEDLFLQLSDEQIGRSAKITVIRGGVTVEVEVKIGERN